MRDPRNFVQSAHNHGAHSGKKQLANLLIPYWYPPVRQVLGPRRVSSIGIAAAKWRLINDRLIERGSQYAHYHLIRFEDLFDAHNSGLRRMCEVLGLEYLADDAEVDTSQRINKSKLKKLGKWPEWPPEDCRLLHEICSPLMQEHGYGLDEAWLARIAEAQPAR